MTAAVRPAHGHRFGGDGTTPVDRFVWYPVRVPPPRPTLGALEGRRVLVTGGHACNRSRVGEALAACGAAVTELALTETSPADPEAVAAAATAAVARIGAVDGIVDLGIAERFELDRHDDWRVPLAHTTAVLQAVYDDWAAETDATRCFYMAVTRLGGRMGYDRHGIVQPLGGVWAGLAKSLPNELPNCRIKVLDLAAQDAAETGRLVALEASTWDYYEVGYQNNTRWTLGCRAAPPPPPRLRLGRDNVVLLSGGGRGVGFALARRIAADVGCRVVVTGRSALPDASEPWLAMDHAEFDALRRQRLRDAAPGDVGAERREHERRVALRELSANVKEARLAGLPIDYRQCDVLDAGQVRALVEHLGDDLRVVIHNAGIAAPTRLARKPPATVLRVVEAKLLGFVNLIRALDGHPLDYFCNVGSAAGRLGGMIGQIDYAAANEVLARLGFWAQQQLGLPVATLCWTTWERLGLVANYDAALRYGSAMRVEDGVEHWLDELLGAEPTEAMFLGRVGSALSPNQMSGFLKFGDHPDLPWLFSRYHYLGAVKRYAPFRSLRSHTSLALEHHPCGNEFTVDGARALPAAVALEYALSVGQWVAPEGWPSLHLRRIRDLEVDLDALVAERSRVELVKEGSGAHEAGDWVVRIRLATAGGREVLRASLVYAGEPPPPPEPVAMPDASEPWAAPPGTGLHWHGAVYRAPAWRSSGPQVVAALTPTADADAWALPYPPLAVLPAAAVEAIVEGAARASAAAGPRRRLRADKLEWTPTGCPEATVVGTPANGTWAVLDSVGRPLLRWSRTRLE